MRWGCCRKAGCYCYTYSKGQPMHGLCTWRAWIVWEQSAKRIKLVISEVWDARGGGKKVIRYFFHCCRAQISLDLRLNRLVIKSCWICWGGTWLVIMHFSVIHGTWLSCRKDAASGLTFYDLSFNIDISKCFYFQNTSRP